MYSGYRRHIVAAPRRGAAERSTRAATGRDDRGEEASRLAVRSPTVVPEVPAVMSAIRRSRRRPFGDDLAHELPVCFLFATVGDF
jgi:hypothetical protein